MIATRFPKAKTYFKALTGPYMDNISEEMVDVWATEMHANRAWLESLGMKPLDIGPAEFPEFDGSDCVEMLVHSEAPAVQNDTASHANFQVRMKNSPVGGERLWKGVTEPALATRRIRALFPDPRAPLRSRRHFSRGLPPPFRRGELGSIYAFNYNAGGNVGECFAFGRIAGRNASNEAPFHA